MIADSTHSTYESKSHSAAQVAAWNRDLQKFFNEDWSRLRTLILELEEDTWSDEERAHSKSVGNSSQSHSSAQFKSDDVVTFGEQKPSTAGRLSELAGQLERQVRINANSGR